MLECDKGRIICARLLLENEADYMLMNEAGTTAKDIAAKHHREIARLIERVCILLCLGQSLYVFLQITNA